MSRDNRNRIIKFVLCTIIGMTATKLIGAPESSTIAVSAILMLYIDRGFTGGLTYCRKRVQTQVILGGILLVIMFLLNTILPFETWIICMLAMSLTIPIGLMIEYKFGIAPLTVSVGNAILIMGPPLSLSYSYYLRRIIYCLIGALIAMLVEFVLMPRYDRRGDTLDKLMSASKTLLDQSSLPDPQPLPNPFNGEIIERNLRIFKADNRWKRYRIEDNEHAYFSSIYAAGKALLEARNVFSKWAPSLSEESLTGFGGKLSQAMELHTKLLDMEFAPDTSIQLSFSLPAAQSVGEIKIAAAILAYLEAVNALVGSHIHCSTAEQEQPSTTPQAASQI